MNRRIAILALILILPALARAEVIEIRVSAEHLGPASNVMEGKQLAHLEATQAALRQTAERFGPIASAQDSKVSPGDLDAFVWALAAIEGIEPKELAGRPAVQVMVRLDSTEAAKQLAELRRQPEEWGDLIRFWTLSESLRTELAEQNRRLPGLAGGDVEKAFQARGQTLAKVEAQRLIAQALVHLIEPEEHTSASEQMAARQKQARAFVERALTLQPSNPDALYKMGVILIREDKASEAEKVFRQALALQPNSSAGHDKLGGALFGQRKLPEAVAEFREAIRLDPRNAIAHADLGVTLKAQRKLAEAVEEFRAAIRLDPDSADARNNLGITLASQGQTQAAVAEFREAVRVRPDLIRGHYNLAIALADLEEDLESIAEFKIVVRLDPDHYRAHYNMGELLRLHGDLTESARQFREYLRLAPQTPENAKDLERAKTFVEAFEDP